MSKSLENYTMRELRLEVESLRKECNAWKKAAKDWMGDHDKLKAKYEPDTYTYSREHFNDIANGRD